MFGREHKILISLLGVVLMAAPVALPQPAPDTDPIASRLMGQDSALAESWVGEIPVASEFQMPGFFRPVLSVVDLSQALVERAERRCPRRPFGEVRSSRFLPLHRVKFFLRLGVGRHSPDEPS